MNIQHPISELHLLRIAKFALGVRQFIAAFNDGIPCICLLRCFTPYVCTMRAGLAPRIQTPVFSAKCHIYFFTTPKCREINFAKQGGDESPHSTERCHARKSEIHPTACSDYFPFGIRLFVIRLFRVAAPGRLIFNAFRICAGIPGRTLCFRPASVRSSQGIGKNNRFPG